MPRLLITHLGLNNLLQYHRKSIDEFDKLALYRQSGADPKGFWGSKDHSLKNHIIAEAKTTVSGIKRTKIYHFLSL